MEARLIGFKVMKAISEIDTEIFETKRIWQNCRLLTEKWKV